MTKFQNEFSLKKNKYLTVGKRNFSAKLTSSKIEQRNFGIEQTYFEIEQIYSEISLFYFGVLAVKYRKFVARIRQKVSRIVEQILYPSVYQRFA